MSAHSIFGFRTQESCENSIEIKSTEKSEKKYLINCYNKYGVTH